MGRSVGAALKAAALLLIFPLLHHERWVCLKIHCWKGELNGGWTEGGVCLAGISISNCVALLSASKHFFLLKRVRKYRLREAEEAQKNTCSPSSYLLRTLITKYHRTFIMLINN